MSKTNYSKKTEIPQFEPSGEDVKLVDCVNVDKYIQLIVEIEEALKQNKITEIEARFLKLGASRWL